MNGSDSCPDTNLIAQLVVTERMSRQNKKYDSADSQMLTQGVPNDAIC